MAISNTSILIKRSTTTGRPSVLQSGEFAYSYASNTLFIGTPGGNGVVNVGGQYYTSTIDQSTSSNTASTLVKRDSNGAFFGRLYGLSNSAVTLNSSRNFAISGSDITASTQSFDGSADVILNASLNSVPGLSAGYYGGSTASSSTIPVVQVAANGRIMSIANTTVTSSFDISDGTTSSQVQSGNTFFHLGTKGITTSVSSNTVTFSTDNTVLRSNTASVGPQVINTKVTVSNDLTVTGNLNVLGNTTSIHVNDYIVDDPMIYLAGNNYTSDIVNIGFAGNYYDGSIERHTGFYRAHDNKQYYLFDNYIPELSGNNQVDRANTSFRVATLTANIDGSYITTSTINGATISGGSISNLSTDLAVADGGTGASTFNAGQIIVGNGTGALQALANTGTAGTYGSATQVPVITTDAWGRVSSVTNTSIAIDAGAITSGTLSVSRGGTGISTATTNAILYGKGTGAFGVTAAAGDSDQSWSNQILTVTNAGVPIWASSMDGGTF